MKQIIVLLSLCRCLLIGAFFGCFGWQAIAQTDFNPVSPPEPGQLTLRLSGNPYWCAQLEQTNENGTYNKDVTVTVKATAESNYDFLSWTEYGSSEVLSNQPEYSFKITKNTHLVAHFQFNPKDNPKDPGVGYYNVITYVQPHRGGSLRQSGQGIYQQGDSVTFSIEPYPDYDFLCWEIDGVAVSKEKEYTLVMPSKHITAKAVMSWNPANLSEPGMAGYLLYLVNPTPTYGSVSQSGKGVYKLGDKVTLTASPFVGYKFDGWYEGETLLSTSLVYEMTITKQKMTVEAKFSADDKKPSLVIGTGDETEGGLVVVKGLSVPGQQITVQAIPEEGFAFEGWYLNGQLIETAGMTYSLFVDKEMKTLVAKFRELPFLLDVNGGEKGWAEVILYRGSTIFLKAKQVSGYIFKGWYYGDNLLSDKYEFKLDVSLLRAAVKTLRAVYVTGAVGNETIQAMPVRISRQGNMLILHSDEPVSQVQIYSFRGTLLLQHDGFVQDLRMEVPEGSLIVRIKTEKDVFIVRKIK